jgi:D-alanine-D-alanine ligase
MKKRLKVLVLFDMLTEPPADQNFSADLKSDEDYKAEAQVMKALSELGHEAALLGVYDDVTLITNKVKEFQPDIIFNSIDTFRGIPAHEKNVVGLIEMLGVPITGTSSAGLMMCKNKGLSKKIMSYHRVKTPAFKVFERGRAVSPIKKLRYPILIKPLREEASYGISQNSLVENDKDFIERIRFVHESMDRDAIAEEFIVGRELYVSLLGDKRLTVLPLREMVFDKVPDGQPKIATFHAKWDKAYQKKHGIRYCFARPLNPGVCEKIEKIAKKTYRLLGISGYARLDIRLTDNDEVVIIEANPNPCIIKDDDFAQSAMKAGIEYNQLIQKILTLAL